MLYVGEPCFVGALFGLYEFRAEFGSEGGLVRTNYGLMGDLAPSRRYECQSGNPPRLCRTRPSASPTSVAPHTV